MFNASFNTPESVSKKTRLACLTAALFMAAVTLATLAGCAAPVAEKMSEPASMVSNVEVASAPDMAASSPTMLDCVEGSFFDAASAQCMLKPVVVAEPVAAVAEPVAQPASAPKAKKAKKAKKKAPATAQ